MNLIINTLIAILMLAASCLHSEAALSVTTGLLWILTGMTWIAALGHSLGEKPKKNPINVRAAISLIWTCVFAFFLAVSFGRVWLPVLMVFGHILLVAVRLMQFEEKKAVR